MRTINQFGYFFCNSGKLHHKSLSLGNTQNYVKLFNISQRHLLLLYRSWQFQEYSYGYFLLHTHS